MSMTDPGGGIPEWDLADRMRKALRHAELGVQEVADYLEVNRNTVSNWINGRITPSTQTLRLWALRCGVSYGWLRGEPPAGEPVAAERRSSTRVRTGSHSTRISTLTLARAA